MPSTRSEGDATPVAAVVALSRRAGADAFPFESSGFGSADFQRAFVELAERLSVLDLILVELDRTGGLHHLDASSGIDAAGRLRLVRRQATLWDLERDAVLWRLSRAGIPSLLLKGAALRLTAYRDPAERSFADLDVLVSRESLQSAVGALVAGGYRQESDQRVSLYLAHHRHLILTKPQGFVVEVHWALDSASSPFQLDPAAFLRDARRVKGPRGADVTVPSPEHMVLHLAHQNLETDSAQLRRLVDIDRVISNTGDFDWSRLASESVRMKLHVVVAFTLRLVQLLLGTTVPSRFIEDLGVPKAARAHLAMLDPVGLVLEQRLDRRAVHELLLLWCLPSLGARLATLKEMVTGKRSRWWRDLGPGEFRGGGDHAATRLTALAKLVTYQATLYPIGMLGLGPRGERMRAFW